MTKLKRSDNVVTIHGVVLDRVKANADVVSVLRKELERAQSGDVIGVAIVRMHADETTSFVHCGQYHVRQMAGAILNMLDEVRKPE